MWTSFPLKRYPFLFLVLAANKNMMTGYCRFDHLRNEFIISFLIRVVDPSQIRIIIAVRTAAARIERIAGALQMRIDSIAIPPSKYIIVRLRLILTFATLEFSINVISMSLTNTKGLIPVQLLLEYHLRSQLKSGTGAEYNITDSVALISVCTLSSNSLIMFDLQ
jgi:hypothetical protein